LVQACGGAPPAAVEAFHQETPCSPLDARAKLREFFATNQIRTSEGAADKNFTITTAAIREPSGKLETQIVYRVDIRATEDANKSMIDLSRPSIRVKGVRERDWREESDLAFEAVFEKRLWNQIHSLCRE
jgi:hypothetical protein